MSNDPQIRRLLESRNNALLKPIFLSLKSRFGRNHVPNNQPSQIFTKSLTLMTFLQNTLMS